MNRLNCFVPLQLVSAAIDVDMLFPGGLFDALIWRNAAAVMLLHFIVIDMGPGSSHCAFRV